MENEKVQEAYKTIEKVAKRFLCPGSVLKGLYDVEDLTQEVFTHFLEKKFFEKFDENQTSFKYFVAIATKRHLIDMTRKRRHKMVSLETPINSKNGESLFLKDVIEEKLVDQFSSTLLYQIIDNCSSEQISPNYNLSWRELLGMFLSGMEPSEIHERVGVSSGRICQLKNQLFDNLLEAC